MRFKGLDLNLLQALDILIEKRSVTRAAEMLNISQPAISAALSRLRNHFGDALLVQHGKQMMPTPFALRLHPNLKIVMGDLDVLISTPAAFDPAHSTRTFQLLASDFILIAVIGDILPLIGSIAPSIRFTISPPTDQSLDMFESGDVDILITPNNYVIERHPVVPFFSERHVVAGWNQNPMMTQPISIEDFSRASFISVQLGRATSTSFAINELRQMGISIDSTLTTTTFASVPLLLIGTDKLAIMHESLAIRTARFLPISYWPLPVAIPPMQEMIQFHRARANDPGVSWLVNQLILWAAKSGNGIH